MKESVTKFDLEAAFKALDDIDVPAVTDGIKANRAALNEIFSRKSKFDALFEDYTEDNQLTESTGAYSWHYGNRGCGAQSDDVSTYMKAAGVTQAGDDPRRAALSLKMLIDDFCDFGRHTNNDKLFTDICSAIINAAHQSCQEKLTFQHIERLVPLFTSWVDAVKDSKYINNELKENQQDCISTLQKQIQQTKNLDDDIIDIFVHTFETDCEALTPYGRRRIDQLKIDLAKHGVDYINVLEGCTKPAKLREEYYDISNPAELDSAKASREAEIAKAKLARIEKIVDLDAESPDDLLTSYVGKFIIQCPQCMTLFYKKPEDVEASEEDPDTVNINEVCQHCGNESGYTLIGKVGAADEKPEAVGEETTIDVDSTADAGFATETTTDEASTEDVGAETDSEELNFDGELPALTADETTDDENEEPEETTEESFYGHHGNYLLQEAAGDADALDISADEFNELINSPEFKKPVSTAATKAMLAALKDDTVSECLTEEVVTNEDEKPEELTEGGLLTLGKAIGKKLAGGAAAAKQAISKAIDDFADDAKTREEKADFILENAMEDYDNCQIDTSGKLVPDEQSKRFKTFVVIGFKEHYSNGKLITMAPSFNNKNLVVGMKRPETKDNYKAADDIAKGWSLRQGNGPAFIYLAKEPDDQKAVFLCAYFKGKLANDQLEKYFEVVQKDMEAGVLMLQGGLTQSQDDEEPANESLNTIFTGLDDLHEASVENLITNSLIETYKNVAGFKLTGCNYLNETLSIDGTIYFVSGNTRKTSYCFSEAYIKNNKVHLHGINEKLGLNKRFILTGTADTNKTFIAESLNYKVMK